MNLTPLLTRLDIALTGHPSLGDREIHIVDPEIVDDMQTQIGKENFALYLDKYIDELHTVMTRIEKHISCNEGENIIDPAHALKSSSAQIGALGASHLASRIEIAGIEGKVDVIKDCWDEIEDGFKQTIASLKAFQSK